MQITLLTPTIKALGALAPKWNQVVRKAGLEPGKPVSRSHHAWPPDLLGGSTLDIADLAAQPFRNDRTEANGSSIAFLAEYGGGPPSATPK